MIGVDGEIILPSTFLAVAEHRGMIRTIDRGVIRQAVGLLEDLTTATRPGDPQHGQPIRLHVNISGRSLSCSRSPRPRRSRTSRTPVAS
jgi:EAL domain-containing protein (putative c-di-GMP-specific phosphodiesterase class I)